MLFKKNKQAPLPSEIKKNDEKILTLAIEQNKCAADILPDSCPAKQIITALNDVLATTFPSCKQTVYEIDQAVLALIKETIIEHKHYTMVTEITECYTRIDECIQLHVNYRVATIKRLLEIRDKADISKINTDETELYKNTIEECTLFEKDANLIEEILNTIKKCIFKVRFKYLSPATSADRFKNLRSYMAVGLHPVGRPDILEIDTQILNFLKSLSNEIEDFPKEVSTLRSDRRKLIWSNRR